jgi:hypothetical protein
MVQVILDPGVWKGCFVQARNTNFLLQKVWKITQVTEVLRFARTANYNWQR